MSICTVFLVIFSVKRTFPLILGGVENCNGSDI